MKTLTEHELSALRVCPGDGKNLDFQPSPEELKRVSWHKRPVETRGDYQGRNLRHYFRVREHKRPVETRGERETIFYEIRRLGSWLRYEALPGIGTLCGRVFAFLFVILFAVGVFCILSMILTPLFAAPVTVGNMFILFYCFRRRD
jgi:hypothetical protein